MITDIYGIQYMAFPIYCALLTTALASERAQVRIHVLTACDSLFYMKNISLRPKYVYMLLQKVNVTANSRKGCRLLNSIDSHVL